MIHPNKALFEAGKSLPEVVLDLDYTVVIPKR